MRHHFLQQIQRGSDSPPPPKLVNTTFTTVAWAARLDAIRPKATARVVVALAVLRRNFARCKRLDASSACRASAGSVLGCVVKWSLPRVNGTYISPMTLKSEA